MYVSKESKQVSHNAIKYIVQCTCMCRKSQSKSVIILFILYGTRRTAATAMLTQDDHNTTSDTNENEGREGGGRGANGGRAWAIENSREADLC